jgi:hypothetical protein
MPSNLESNEARLERLMKIVAEYCDEHECGFNVPNVVKEGLITESDAEFLRVNIPNPMTEEPSSDPTTRLGQLLGKVCCYQQMLAVDRAIEMDELVHEKVFDESDIEFIRANNVTYKPHRLGDYHAGDMFHMPTAEGCVFIGPTGPPLKPRRAAIKDLPPIIGAVLKLPDPDLLLHIELPDCGGIALSPGSLLFTVQSDKDKGRAQAIRDTAGKHGFAPKDDYESSQGDRFLSFKVDDNSTLASLTVIVLQSGCGLAADGEITYSAGALDVLENYESNFTG